MDIASIKPQIVEDLFTVEEYDWLYHVINRCIDDNLSKGLDKYAGEFRKFDGPGFIVYSRKFPDAIPKRFLSVMEPLLGAKLKNLEMVFSRYCLESGSAPNLRTHYDTLKYPGVTVSLKLDSTLDWDVYVEGERFQLDTNDGVLFSGSHQIHWRPRKQFNDGDYYDILVFHAREDIDDQELSEAHFEYMNKKKAMYRDKYSYMINDFYTPEI